MDGESKKSYDSPDIGITVAGSTEKKGNLSQIKSPEKQQVTELDEIEEVQKKYMWRHIFIVMFLQATTTSNWFLLSYLTNVFTQVYVTAIVSAVSEIIGYSVSGLILERFGIIVAFASSSFFGSVGILCILFYGLEHQDDISF